MPRSGKRRVNSGCAILAVLAIIAAWVWQEALRPPVTGRFEVTFLSVGQGDCAFVRTPSGGTMLVDGGAEGTSDVGYKLIVPFLRREGVNRIDVLVLTHPHSDHLNGLGAVLDEFQVTMVLDPGIPHTSKGYRDFLTTVRDRGIDFQKAFRGQVVELGGGTMVEVLNPPETHLAGTEDDVNSNSIVLRVTAGPASVMLMGDAGRDAEADMLASGRSVKSDLLKVGHHGSDDSTGDAWLDAVRPGYAVISAGRGNPFGHPHREVLQRLSDRGIRVYRTDRDGAVSASFRDGGWIVQGSIQGD